ncbi:hypothetical protein GCM10010172_12440 [Paractinoplanes ferrugineus]|uniref:4-amino-4-deoxy-L-arabinose transferase-like glycosyltransferase n=1 Tax=Paractinoplanes ferrugineus TaxID=113564 RepID=A0A919IX64_9ACTN|nr:hypothetical protein [Actinoplanes ferrugineus]GIE09809.1 hypothetical protein Afe05nite_16490 [Actinoplanes ferrugineus]
MSSDLIHATQAESAGGRTDSETGHRPAHPLRWLPAAVTFLLVTAILAVAHTDLLDIARYTAYATLAVMLPGTLVFRALRRRPHTLVEDLAMGTALGLVLELPAWAAYSVLDLRSVVWTWPLLVVVPFLIVPRLRAHWRPRGYQPVPLGWSWSVGAVIVFFTSCLYGAFFRENPILPDAENTRQFIDLPYQLSLAGEAKHHFPLDLPQVAGEPLNYHWFAFVHAAMVSLVGHIDLPVVTMRLMVPAIIALTAVLTAVAGWRLAGRPYAGVVAAMLFLVVGEFQFSHPFSISIGVQVAWITWPSLSMTYSWALLLALIVVIGDALRRPADDSLVPPLGRGAYVLAVFFAFASSAAKASSLPVTLAGLALAGVATLVRKRRVPWVVVALGVVVTAALGFVTVVIFRGQTYGLGVHPLQELSRFWAVPEAGRSGGKQATIVAGVFLAWLLSLQLRLAGIVPLLVMRRFRLEPVHWFLLGGALSGPALYLLLGTFNATWFYRASLPFGLLLSAWGYVMVADRARLTRRATTVLGVGAAAFVIVLLTATLLLAGPEPSGRSYSPVLPVLGWAGVLAGAGLIGALGWWAVRRRPGVAGRGPLVVLTAVLLAGAPGLIMEARRNWEHPNGGSYGSVPVPASRVEAARWVRANSDPDDVLATNVHCWADEPPPRCRDARSFWLSGYAERSVLVEGWAFAPRLAASPSGLWQFWDARKLKRNDDAIYAPTADGLHRLRDRDHVRYLVVDRRRKAESPLLVGLADLRFDNGRMAVYELR